MKKVKGMFVAVFVLIALYSFTRPTAMNSIHKNTVEENGCDCLELVKAEFLRTNEFNHLDYYDYTYKNNCDNKTIELQWWKNDGKTLDGSHTFEPLEKYTIQNVACGDNRGFDDGRCRVKQ